MNTRFFYLIIIFIFVSGCSEKEPRIISVVDRQEMKMLFLTGEKTELKNIYDADFVIIGGSLGGIAATIAACSSGRTAILIEETDSVAGCFASQDTSKYFDNRFMEETGSSVRYNIFRSKIREWYKKESRLQPQISGSVFSGFMDFGTNNFCFESEAAIDVIYEMLEKYIERESLTILKRHKIAEVVYFKERLSSLNVVDLDNKIVNQITGWMFIEATETGDFLPLAGIEYSIGSESETDTNEPHAPDNADSLNAFEYYYYPEMDLYDGDNIYEVDLLANETDKTGSLKKVAVATEPRRINSFTRITEQDISADYQHGPRARFFNDSVGIGYSLINITRKGSEPENFIIDTKPFQIPLGALIIPKFSNFISAGRTIGTTYITSNAYSAPSVLWAIGEAAGEIAAFCAGNNITTHNLMERETDFNNFRNWFVKNYSVPVYWYDDITPDDPDFLEAQMKPFDVQDYNESAKSLHFAEQ